jgi:hypothetical protein
LLDVGKMTAIASEMAAKEPTHTFSHSRSISSGGEEFSDLVLTFEDARCKLSSPPL